MWYGSLGIDGMWSFRSWPLRPRSIKAVWFRTKLGSLIGWVIWGVVGGIGRRGGHVWRWNCSTGIVWLGWREAILRGGELILKCFVHSLRLSVGLSRDSILIYFGYLEVIPLKFEQIGLVQRFWQRHNWTMRYITYTGADWSAKKAWTWGAKYLKWWHRKWWKLYLTSNDGGKALVLIHCSRRWDKAFRVKISQFEQVSRDNMDELRNE
jgi:hypothetical protein